MDEHSQGDDTMMTCRIIKLKLQGNVELQYFPQPIDTVVMEMATNGGTKFNEKAQNYQRSRLMDGRPDRSKAGPYQ